MTVSALPRPSPRRIARRRNPDTCTLALKWAFSLMVDLQGHRQLLERGCITDDEVARELGLEELVDAEHYSRTCALQCLKREYRLFTRNYPAPDYPEPLGSNLQALGRLVGLDEAETRVLGFCALLHADPLLNRCSDVFGAVGFNRLSQALSVLLELSDEEIQHCLATDGHLTACGLLTIQCDNGRHDLEETLSFTSSDLLKQLRFHRGAAEELFEHSFRLSAPASLTVTDYEHLSQPLAMVMNYLQKVAKQQRKGVNILLYGPPGTGKTELCRLLAEELALELYEIACTDSEGDPITGYQRLCALRSAMSVLKGSPVLVMLDEIEDLFVDDLIPNAKRRKAHKGWINRILEENGQPCFWLSNHIGMLDPAYIRRFDMVIEMPNPIRSQRERIIRNLCADRLGEETIQQLATHEYMTPAVFERAYRVAHTISPRVGKKLNGTLEYLVDSTLKAQGHERLGQHKGIRLPTVYSPERINTDIDLDGLLEGLRRHSEARLCFYGPPGTGKTAFAGWLAESLDKPLHIKRVSDLVSPYLGETEQRLAAAFRQAEQESAVLVLDEVDSFLQDRRKAQRSWEITAVNEMLTQMESYSGLFIASTNLMADLDEAALRRFDLKVRFGYLRPEQRLLLLRAHLKELGLKDPQHNAEAALQTMDTLTPGDFTTVVRRARFKPFTNAAELVQALVNEAALKKDGQARPIGFVY
ncbi:ATP-binding protein [Azomonas macrocytogenes]|uniref:SpoVK/Ycf46/Vps4 family AAA+-type ATPase n=1 Tax=Azomonas macrocytogenes TaxID=69962 RepID=A0A839T1N3_AZOMA|nr:ATP-binding protein [Azomonas macrocytogenes]MBB3102304.1 SpoVK/Ycf46/Vps4 family AAA+-type ATPase [Azomonas macrocytogenes]